MSLVPLEVGVLLIQAEGEFEERLRAAGLEPIVRRPSMLVYIMADGRRLWRVFDNLLEHNKVLDAVDACLADPRAERESGGRVLQEHLARAA
ncbi:MAG: hypothetical protein ACLR5G_09070 [Eubacteriales bacterium]